MMWLRDVARTEMMDVAKIEDFGGD